MSDLHSQLKQLPLEDPIGSDDIYGRDISLGFFTDEFQWQNGMICTFILSHDQNWLILSSLSLTPVYFSSQSAYIGGPEGCNRSPSSTQATEQQKAVFNELVERVLSVSQKFAIKKQD